MSRTSSIGRAVRGAVISAGIWLGTLGGTVTGGEPTVIDLWPGEAPGETSSSPGEALPRRATENPPATRIQGITRPQLHRYDPPEGQRTGAAVLIFPGGGYNYVVVDKEGSEAAAWLNRLGITALVVHYRTKRRDGGPGEDWIRPLEDGQRGVSLVRQRAAAWKLDPRKIGVLGFSAGGQAAALVATRFQSRQYTPRDEIDRESCRPDFAMLVYPWQLVDASGAQLKPLVDVGPQSPPTFLVHAHDDGATSLSSVLFYAALKRHKIDAELHIYRNGGHGYGMRAVPESDVDTWTDRAADWLRGSGLAQTAGR